SRSRPHALRFEESRRARAHHGCSAYFFFDDRFRGDDLFFVGEWTGQSFSCSNLKCSQVFLSLFPVIPQWRGRGKRKERPGYVCRIEEAAAANRGVQALQRASKRGRQPGALQSEQEKSASCAFSTACSNPKCSQVFLSFFPVMTVIPQWRGRGKRKERPGYVCRIEE